MAMKKTRKKIVSAVGDARTAMGPTAENAVDKVTSATEQALSSVAASVSPALSDARDRIAPLVEDARGELSTAVEDAKDYLVPAAAQAVAAGKARGRRAAVSLGLAEEPKRSHKFRKLLVLLGVGGVAAFVYKKLTGKDAEPDWTASHSAAPRAAPSTGTSTAPVDQSDTAPTAPFASEETVESTVPTTPDEPLEEKQV